MNERIPYADSGETASVVHERLLDAGGLSSTLFQKILIPIELDPQSQPLTSLAADLAARFQSHIILAHVVPHEPTLARDPSVISKRRAALEKTARQLRTAGASQVEIILAEGNPALHIEQLARQHNVSLILLSDRADQPAYSAWFGTLTQKLSRRLQTPLMVVKPGVPSPLKPILCVVDFSESSRSALKYAIWAARNMETSLSVLHVVPEPLPFPLVEGPIWQGCSTASASAASRYASASDVKDSDSDVHRIEEAKLDLEQFLLEYDLAGVRYDIIVRSGSPVVETLTVAKERKSGAIAIGSDHHSGFVHFMSQSTAETLAETADIPVLIFHGGAERPMAPHIVQSLTKEQLPIN